MATIDTLYFHIVSDDDPDSIARALAIAQTCDTDLETIEQIFSTNFRTGATELWPIWVFVLTAVAGRSAANNDGYRPDGITTIRIFATYTANTPVSDPALAALEFDELARQMFVAELAEIVMNYTGLFSAGDSTGEALSIYISSLLHPKGYYLNAGTSPGAGPRILKWLQTPNPTNPSQRQDWISQTELTDQNFVSFGCAKLFLHYLVSQLGYPIERVIQEAGVVLPLSWVYNRLTGNPPTQAFTDFSTLIEAHLPLSKVTAGAIDITNSSVLGSDNIFPLRDIAGRRITLSEPSESLVRKIPKDPKVFDIYGPTIELKPGPFCPPAVYFCELEREIYQVSTSAVATGLLSAAIKFTVNGVGLSTVGTWDTVTVPAETTFQVPGRKRVVTNTNASIRYIILPSWNRSDLYIQNTTAEGTFTLVITASANESAVGDAGVLSDSRFADVTAVTLLIEDKYYSDRKNCDPTFYAIGTDLKDMSEVLANAYNRPNPPPDGLLIDLVNRARGIEPKLSKAAEESGLRRSEILHEFSISGETKIPFRIVNGGPETLVKRNDSKASPVDSQLLSASRSTKG